MGAGTEALGDFRRGGQQRAGHQQEHRHPDRVAQRHRRQVARPDPAGHHRIDEAHRRGGQLRDHDRQGQAEQVFQLQADPGGAGEGRAGGVVGHGVQGQNVQICWLRGCAFYRLTQRSGKDCVGDL
ncbi:hypothetical protein D3C76_982150 [compost metagenome]